MTWRKGVVYRSDQLAITNTMGWGLAWRSSGFRVHTSLHAEWVWSLLRELRCHIPRGKKQILWAWFKPQTSFLIILESGETPYLAVFLWGSQTTVWWLCPHSATGRRLWSPLPPNSFLRAPPSWPHLTLIPKGPTSKYHHIKNQAFNISFGGRGTPTFSPQQLLGELRDLWTKSSVWIWAKLFLR